MAQRVYLETSIISYLAARPSRDLITAARQQITHDWWTLRRAAFEVCISELVVAEAGAGDRDAAERRAQVMRDIPLLSIPNNAVALAEKLVKAADLPKRAQADALHVAIAACHGIDLEFGAYCQCAIPTQGGEGLSRQWLRATSPLHAR
jgi:predicted nucleic acid-binding protein